MDGIAQGKAKPWVCPWVWLRAWPRAWKINWVLLGIVIGGVGAVSIQPAVAGVFELSGSFSFSESNYGNSNYQWTRRWGLSLGYYFLELSEIELSAQDVLYRTKLDLIEDTTFHDQIYSVDWVQSFATRRAFLQPYVKVGVGQLYREASGSYAGGVTPPAVYDTITGVLGAGLRIFVMHSLAIKGEATTYLTDGVLSTWQDNFAIEGGISIYF